MQTDPIPANPWPIATDFPPYWLGLDILESHWERTKPYATHEPSSKTFQEYMFWRRVSMLWTCATIEAFVNEEGVAWLGEEFYNESIERLERSKKLRILYALKYHRRLPTKIPELKGVLDLFDLRNSIVHPKSQEVGAKRGPGSPQHERFHRIEFQDLREACQAMVSLFEPAGVGETGDDDCEQRTT